jgi:hypothetical protein
MKISHFLLLIPTLIFSVTSSAHHSDAGLDESAVVVLEGKITDFSWRQPHVYFSIESQSNGELVKWDVQMVSVNNLARKGWNSRSLSPGDNVIARVNPAINGKPYGKLASIVRADGTPVAVAPDAVEASFVAAESIGGKWTGIRPGPAVERSEPEHSTPAQADGTPACTSGFDCFFRTNLVLTDAAIAAQKAFDPLSADNPEATCIGRPTPSALMSARGYLLEIDDSQQTEKIIIRSEWFNEERTVWMDGRTHPDASQTLATGHSIGHWEGDILVVDTRNFDDHRSPYQIGVPSGSQKHVVERYKLSDDKTSMAVEYVLEDPEFLAQPLVHTNHLYHAPHMDMLATSCNIENTSRFLK